MEKQKVQIPVHSQMEELDCRNCGMTEHIVYANAPASLFTEGDGLIAVSVCDSCGTAEPFSVTQAFREKFLDNLVEFMLDNEIVTEEEAEDLY